MQDLFVLALEIAIRTHDDFIRTVIGVHIKYHKIFDLVLLN